MSSASCFAVFFVFLLATICTAKVYQPCEVADVLKKQGLKSDTIGNWVCLAKFSSGFNSGIIKGPHPDGSHSYGIFQINEKYCKLKSKDSCGELCSALATDDLTPSVRCALKIFKKQGFSAWSDWRNDCKGRDVSQYVKRCSLKRYFADEEAFE